MGETIELLKKERCTGCKSCGDVCPVKAIAFYSEKDGLWFPKINHDKCIGCSLCYKKCSSLSDITNQHESVLQCYGVKSKDEETRFNSTSGGFFTELANKWIEDDGIVIGAAYNDKHLVYHTYASNKEDIKKLRRSKYVQSDTSGIYKKTKELLDQGRDVLFCGTPCQVEALLLFLNKTHENLLTLDFVCCGICSPGIYKMYLEELEHQYKSKVTNVWFKNKEEGWGRIGTRIEFSNGKHYFKVGSRDLFMTSFVTDALSMRLSCEECKYRKLPHNSDIMLGDFWGIDKVNPVYDDNMGISAVLINSQKGIKSFDSIKDNLDFFETTKEDISKGNFTIYKPKHVNPNRDEFIKLMNSRGFKKAMSRYSTYSGLNRIKIDLIYNLGKFKRRLVGSNK
jgi:coenzyme F420-reducing hydrogenase beta subunit